VKLSALIKKLQAIHDEVPFDSDVVTGDDYMPTLIKSVYHEPPYTFIQFESSESDDEEFNENSKALTFERIAELSKLMSKEEQAELIRWEKEFVTGDGALATTDWPGWTDVFSRLSH
jgi:hypothetical protein